MNDYELRPAEIKDISFLAEAVIAGEKGITDKCNFCTLFNVPENMVTKHLISMFEEGIDGCEFSLSSYFVVEYKGETVASFGGWIEGFEGELPSKFLKSNLINFTFAKESIACLKTKTHLVKELIIERTPQTLQLEYLYVKKKHRGNRLPALLTKRIEERALEIKPDLKMAEFQLFSNNSVMKYLFEKNGYAVVNKVKANNLEILNYLPSDEKLVMAKKFY